MKKIILASFFIPSLVFASVVGQSSYVQVKNEKEKILFEKSKIALTNVVSEMVNVCSKDYKDPNSCLCDNPNIKNKLNLIYEAIIYQIPEWDNKIIELKEKKIDMINVKSFSKYNKCVI